MEELRKRHRQEQRDFQSQITHKKKSATKMTRKGINDECAELERQLSEKQESEIDQFGREMVADVNNDLDEPLSGEPKGSVDESIPDGTEESMQTLSLSPSNIGLASSKKPNRQKARLARRAAEQDAASAKAAEEANGLPDRRKVERDTMSTEIKSRGFAEQDIRSDGHCLYAAVADQLIIHDIALQPQTRTAALDFATNDMPAYRIIRHITAQYITEHADDFLPFVEEPLVEYVSKIRDTGEWGGHLELSALARVYSIVINVLQGDGKVEKIEPGYEETSTEIWLAYYRHSFGLGEHYNSLRQPP